MTGGPTLAVKLDDGTGTFPHDITSKVWLKAGMTVTRGRQDQFATVQPSTLSLSLDNTDGRFTLGSTSGGYGAINTDRMIRVTMTVGATTSHRFTGYVQTWPVEWPDGSDTFSVATITAVDRFARLGRRRFRSVIEQEYLSTVPSLYFVLNESSETTGAYDSAGVFPSVKMIPASRLAGYGIGGGPDPVFGVATGPAGDNYTAVTIDDHGRFLRTDNAFALSATTFAAVECFLLNTANGTGAVAYLTDNAVTEAISIDLIAGALRCFVGVAGNNIVLTPATTIGDGNTHHVLFTATDNGDGTTTARVFLDGVLLSSSSTGSTLATLLPAPLAAFSLGGATDGSYDTPGPDLTLAHAAVYVNGTPLTVTEAALHSTAGATAFAGEATDARIARIARWANIATADLALDAGKATVAAIDTTGSSPIDAMTAVIRVENGLLFVRGDGDLVMQHRNRRSENVTPDATVSASSAVDPESNFAGDMQQVINYAEITRTGGGTATAKSSASIVTHEQYPLLDEYPFSTDDEAQYLASWLVNTYAEPRPRMPSAAFDLMTLPQATVEALLALELSDYLQITGLPAQAPAATADLTIEGWNESLSHDAWSITFNTSDQTLSRVWLLGDATFGVLGSTTKLAL